MRKNEIIIIGAGIAGLSAARILHDHGLSVTILEARDRAGGRVWTDNSLGVPLDMGASWIHGIKKNPIHKLVKQHRIKTLVTDYESGILYDADGRAFPDSEVVETEKRFNKLMKKLDVEREELDEDMSLKDGIEMILAKQDLTDTQRRLLEYWITAEIEHDISANTSDLSLWYWDQDEEFKGDHVIFPGGYSQIVTQLAKDLDIRYEEVVEHIQYNEDGVTIKTANKHSYTASHAIITLPLGVLKNNQVNFSPPLPKKKQKAIQRLNMGDFCKVYLRFPDIFWDKEYEFIEYTSNKQGQWVSWMNYYPYIKHPILVAFNTGQFARTLEKMPDTEIVAQAMSTLKTIYGNSIPNPTDSFITRWGRDPYTLGAYSYIPVGSKGKHYDHMAEPVDNRLFFAGESTYREYPATVHGAFLSGIREAKRIIKLF